MLDRSGTDLFVEDDAFASSAGRVDTGFDVGQTFNFGVKLTAETAALIGAATYTVEHQINGTTLLTQTGKPMLLGTADTFGNSLKLFITDNDGATATPTDFRFDSAKLSTVAAVPEPSSLAMIGCLGLVGVVAHRRR